MFLSWGFIIFSNLYLEVDMPTFVYFCPKCKKPHEIFHSVMEGKNRYCPRCGTKMTKVIGGIGGLILKGSGFHANDYPKGDKWKNG